METQQQNNFPKLPFAKSHAFIIGIDKYRDTSISPLKTAVNDAKKIAEVLQQEQDFEVYEPLLNATCSEIGKLLEKTLLETVREYDRVFFYYAGHGVAVEGTDGRPSGYLVPADAEAKNIAKTSVPMSLLYEALNALECKHGLLVLDCCFSGAFRWSSGYRDLMNFGPETLCQEHFDRFVREPSWKVITSAAYDQKALDVLDGQPTGERGVLENGKHSPFAQYLFEGLAGKADVLEDGQEGDGVITAPELYEHICKHMVPASMELGDKQRQTPDFFPLSDKDRQGQFIFLNRNNRRHLPSI
ncbi:MAG: caspase domain-containing protein, partial [bacterium]